MQTQRPIRPTDDEARTLARDLLRGATHGALAVTDPDTGAPYASRIALGLSPQGRPLSLISDLAHHTRALRANPACALLLGEPGPKGDPLIHPRLTLMARARFVPRDSDAHSVLAAHYLQSHPKAKLYIGFADFGFVLFDVTGAHLNGGFGKAFHLIPADLFDT
ncbi:HugZ family pyridoxamine 5'-phosphate oxidase [Actibacterium sp. D379-3]